VLLNQQQFIKLKIIIMKKTNIIFWITTLIIFLFESVLSAFTFQSELAKQGMSHLGYPLYFGNFLVLCKVLGGLALIIPGVSSRIKEWAYAGFAFDFIGAAVSHGSVDGIGNFQTIFPLIFLGLLILSYISYQKREAIRANTVSKKIAGKNASLAAA
jgi:hypothetical protein